MNLPPVVGRLVGDNSDYVRSLKDAESATKGHTDRSSGHFSKLGETIKKAVVLGTAAAGVAVGGFVLKAISAASDLAETVSKVGVVFGDQAKQVTGFANDMASKFGLPKTAILDAAASIGLIGKASGLSQGDAAKMSTQLAKLAADASSFYNVPLPEALQAIQSGLVGEAEPMRRFGVLLNEQAVSAEAARLGLEKTNGEYSEGAKAQARASLIMRGMTDASGDLERTQGSLANRIRELRGRFDNFAASAGTVMVPALLKLMDVGERVGAVVGPALKNAFDSEGATEAWTKIKATVLDAVDAIVGWVREHWPEIKRIITETLQTVQAVVKGVVDVVTTIWENFGSQIKDLVAAAWRYVRDTIEGALNVIQGIVKVITGIIHGDWGQVWEGIKQIIAGAWEMIQARIDLGLNIIKNIISVAMEIVKGIFSGAWNTVFEVTRNILATVVDVFLGAVEFIINGAARAFGWIPGIGPKLREAADRFAEFRDEVNDKIRGIDANITVTADISQAWSQLDYLESRARAAEAAMNFGVPARYRAAGGRLDTAAIGKVLGFKTRGPTLVGEGNPAYPEYVLATDPLYRQRNLRLFAEAASALGVGGMAMGSSLGGGVAGSRVMHVTIQIVTPTGDIPDSTIRKFREQLIAMTDDYPAGSIVPAA